MTTLSIRSGRQCSATPHDETGRDSADPDLWRWIVCSAWTGVTVGTSRGGDG